LNLRNVDVQSTRRKKEGKKGGRKSERDVLVDCIRKKKRETLEREREEYMFPRLWQKRKISLTQNGGERLKAYWLKT
jgi:hypothetical protein